MLEKTYKNECSACKFKGRSNLECLKGENIIALVDAKSCLEYELDIEIDPNKLIGVKIKALLVSIKKNDGFVTYKEKTEEFSIRGNNFIVLTEAENIDFLRQVYYDGVYCPMIDSILKIWDVPIPFVVPDFNECFSKYLSESELVEDVVIQLPDQSVKLYITKL
ncbi:hypothetical protein JHD46_05445 [Sulfurimonas sp. SAG-AH-194-C20]|nr:hypothetical protein [Sulfurimonas sp. SAG-AH-194-C20]MDF1879084.1 hypothetical protein [Sulfurimonas sp. SAG-AH-194-C20]